MAIRCATRQNQAVPRLETDVGEVNDSVGILVHETKSMQVDPTSISDKLAPPKGHKEEPCSSKSVDIQRIQSVENEIGRSGEARQIRASEYVGV